MKYVYKILKLTCFYFRMQKGAYLAKNSLHTKWAYHMVRNELLVADGFHALHGFHIKYKRI